jgi:magnesium chelatase subunit D
LAARLVLAPRALVFPQQQESQAEQPREPSRESPEDDGADRDRAEFDRALDDVILAAVQAALPPDVLAALRALSGRSHVRSQGKSGALQKANRRGRPSGVRRGDLRAGGKLNVIETLRAAAPWQPLRLREAAAGGLGSGQPHVLIRKDDFRISRFKQRSETTTIFVVDASGSAALHRLAEAKGAVELLLADCYIRRDQVAMIAFRGSVADLLLPPTRSLARAKRSLAGLPGGGGTPLASGLDAAVALADTLRRKGQTPTVIVLTDGRANIARDGSQGRSRAEQDVIGAARQLRAAGINAVLVDTSPRPGVSGEAVAKEMGARYLPLPHADATTLSNAVRATMR